MAHAIGCLGESAATTVYRRERAKAEHRQHARKAVARGPIRNQDRKITFAVVSRPEEKEIKLVKVRKGHLHHLATAYLYANVQYVEKVVK